MVVLVSSGMGHPFRTGGPSDGRDRSYQNTHYRLPPLPQSRSTYVKDLIKSLGIPRHPDGMVRAPGGKTETKVPG